MPAVPLPSSPLHLPKGPWQTLLPVTWPWPHQAIALTDTGDGQGREGLQEELTRDWKSTSWELVCVCVCVCVCACTLTHMLIKERGWKRKTFPPKKITQSVLSLDWKVSNFLCTHHAFKFGNNFSLCDFSCFATNIANSQKTDRKGNGNRKSEFKSWFFLWLAVWPYVYSRP